MQHLEFAALESASLDADVSWERWFARAERALARSFGDKDFDLDGDQEADGYSIDGAYAAFKAGRSVAEYVASVRIAAASAELRVGLDALLVKAA